MLVFVGAKMYGLDTFIGQSVHLSDISSKNELYELERMKELYRSKDWKKFNYYDSLVSGYHQRMLMYSQSSRYEQNSEDSSAVGHFYWEWWQAIVVATFLLSLTTCIIYHNLRIRRIKRVLFSIVTKYK